MEEGSLQRSADGLQVQFVVTDQAQRVPVRYQGLLPDLFKEGKGVVASGRLQGDGVFAATEVLVSTMKTTCLLKQPRPWKMLPSP